MLEFVADANIDGHARLLSSICTRPPWDEWWVELGVTIHAFAELGLPPEASDALVWDRCQQRNLILITGNRNADCPDSLESTLRVRANSHSLPVLTLADPRRVMRDRAYAGRVVERLISFLVEIDRLRGTGRLFLP